MFQTCTYEEHSRRLSVRRVHNRKTIKCHCLSKLTSSSTSSTCTTSFFHPEIFVLFHFPVCHVLPMSSTCPLSRSFHLSVFFSASLQFVEHCSTLTQDCPEVLTFLQTKHAKASPDFLSSVEFRNTLGRCLTRAQAQRSKTFVYINELCTVFRQHTAKKRQILTKAEPGSSTSMSSSLQSTSVMLKGKDKTEVKLEEVGGNPSAEDEQPSTSGLQEDNKVEEQETEKRAKRASRKQVSVALFCSWIIMTCKSFSWWLL